jgi:hypothetical protein
MSPVTTGSPDGGFTTMDVAGTPLVAAGVVPARSRCAPARLSVKREWLSTSDPKPSPACALRRWSPQGAAFL